MVGACQCGGYEDMRCKVSHCNRAGYVYERNDLQDEHIGNIYFKGVLPQKAEGAKSNIALFYGATANPFQSPKQEWSGHIDQFKLLHKTHAEKCPYQQKRRQKDIQALFIGLGRVALIAQDAEQKDRNSGKCTLVKPALPMEKQEGEKQEKRDDDGGDATSSDKAVEQGKEQIEIEDEAEIPLKAKTADIPEIQRGQIAEHIREGESFVSQGEEHQIRKQGEEHQHGIDALETSCVERFQCVVLQRPAQAVTAVEEEDVHPDKPGIEYRPKGVSFIYSDKVGKEYADDGYS